MSSHADLLTYDNGERGCVEAHVAVAAEQIILPDAPIASPFKVIY